MSNGTAIFSTSAKAVPVIEALWITAVSLCADDRRTDTASLTIMTFNAEFLWDGVEPEDGADTLDFPWRHSQTEAEEHMAKVAEIVIRANPDILNLVEVENLDALTTFNTKFLTGRGYRPYLVNGKDTATGQDVGLLTRIDPDGNQIRRDDRQGHISTVSKSVSKNYIANITVGANQITFIAAHLRAFPTRPDLRLTREAQADALRSIALESIAAGRSLILWGDFNDYDGNSDAGDHLDDMPITTVLSLLRALDPVNPEDDLVNAASFMPKASRYTAFWDKNNNQHVDPPGEFSSIDHILLSRDLASKVEVVTIPHDHDPAHHPDHFPVVVRLRMDSSTVTASGSLRIESLLPNPPGDESVNEAVTLKNTGTATQSLTGWRLRDLAGHAWTLDADGSLAAGEVRQIKRNRRPMAMNNSGDTIDLVNPSNQVVQSVTYPHVDEGEIVTPSH